MIKRIDIATASGRGVAERWRSQYQRDGKWTRTVSGDSEIVYNKLCELGQSPSASQVSEVIGNKNWAHLNCSGCGEYVEQAVTFGRDYSDNELMLCEACVDDAKRVLDTRRA